MRLTKGCDASAERIDGSEPWRAPGVVLPAGILRP